MTTIMLKRLIIATLLVLLGCSLPEVKHAKFQKDSKQVIEELKSLKSFEDADIKWRATSLNDKTTKILLVQLVNGKGMADNEAELRDLGKEALLIVNSSIENEQDYDKFQVVFVQKASTGLVTTSFTRDFEYSLDELK